MNLRDWLRGFLNPWVVGGAVIVAIALLCVTLLTLWWIHPGPTPAGPPTAVLNVIQAPTATPIPDTPTPSPSQLTPTLPIPPSPPPGVISVGTYVQITGTGGDGLRLRSQASLQGDVLFLALESEVFQVEDGPRQEDGYTWWYLVAPYDETVRGWAVSNYLSVVQNP